MIFDLVTHIKDNILANNPVTFQVGLANAVQLQNGKIVTTENREFIYSGLKDTEQNYFYIRTLEDITFADPAESHTSCKEIEGTAPLRLVAWVHNGNVGALSEVLLQDIMNTDFDTLSLNIRKRFSNWSLDFTTIIYDREEIFKDETNKEDEEVKLPKNVTIIAIDFVLTYGYKTKQGDIASCLDRNVCVGCS